MKRSRDERHVQASRHDSLESLGIPTLFCRRPEIRNSLFREIVQDKDHKLHSLLPVRTKKLIYYSNVYVFSLYSCSFSSFDYFSFNAVVFLKFWGTPEIQDGGPRWPLFGNYDVSTTQFDAITSCC